MPAIKSQWQPLKDPPAPSFYLFSSCFWSGCEVPLNKTHRCCCGGTTGTRQRCINNPIQEGIKGSPSFGLEHASNDLNWKINITLSRRRRLQWWWWWGTGAEGGEEAEGESSKNWSSCVCIFECTRDLFFTFLDVIYLCTLRCTLWNASSG